MRPRRRARLLLAALLLVALAGWQGWQCHTSPALPFTSSHSSANSHSLANSLPFASSHPSADKHRASAFAGQHRLSTFASEHRGSTFTNEHPASGASAVSVDAAASSPQNRTAAARGTDFTESDGRSAFASVPAEVGAHVGFTVAAFGGVGSGHEEPAAMLACLSFLAALVAALFVLARPRRVMELVSQAREAVSVGWFGGRAPRLAQLGVMRT